MINILSNPTNGHIIYIVPVYEETTVSDMKLKAACNKILHVSKSGTIKSIKDRWGGVPHSDDPMEILINEEVDRRLKALLLQQALDC